jgi:FkbM family methyltransferase
MFGKLNQYVKRAFIKAVPARVKQLLVQDYLEHTYPIAFGGLRHVNAQQGEDLALLRYFGNKKKGFYVDIGAFHPITYSNTQLLYEMGWSGINVEPNPDHFIFFEQLRTRDINLNMAAGTQHASLTYYLFNQPALNTFSEQHKLLWEKREGYQIVDTLPLEVTPLAEILNKHIPAGTNIDFLTIDVENWDLEVLASNDWERFRPELVLAEHQLDFLQPMGENPLVAFMYKENYSIWEICGGTILFKDNKRITKEGDAQNGIDF